MQAPAVTDNTQTELQPLTELKGVGPWLAARLEKIGVRKVEDSANGEHVSVIERDGDTSSMTFVLQVKNRRHLARVMRAIRAMPDIYRVARATA